MESAIKGTKNCQNGTIFCGEVVQYIKIYQKKSSNQGEEAVWVLQFLVFQNKQSSENVDGKIRGH